MIIGVDVREGVREKRAGKGEYVYQLIGQLIKSSEHKFVLFSDMEVPQEWKQANVKTIIFNSRSFIWQLKTFLYLEFLRPVDVYFSTTSLIIPSLVRSLPVITTLFDFVSFLFPDQHQRRAVILEKMWMKLAIKASRRLLAISEHTQKDAIKLFNVNPKKITVTYLAASFNKRQEEIKLGWEDIILFIGTLEPRKNLVRLVRAFNKLRSDNIITKLLLVGRWGWQSDAIKREIEQSQFKNDIRVLGYVKSSQKKSLYQQAKILAFPTLYEGFGMPVVEAMVMGVPVITSNVSSLPEVAGDAAVLVNPESEEDIYGAFKKILTNKEFAQQLINKGHNQVLKFNWENTAKITLDVLVNKK